MLDHEISGGVPPTVPPSLPFRLGDAVAGGLAVCARAVGADGALLEDTDAQKCVALWAGSASAVECSRDFRPLPTAHGGQRPAVAPSSLFPTDILQALGFVPAAAWSSEAFSVDPRRHRLTLVWRRPPPGPLSVLETAAVVRALLAADRDRDRLDDLRARLVAVSGVAMLGRAAAAAGHDFNNLLGSIIGSAELVLDRVAGDDEACAELEHLMSTAERGAGVVRRLSVLAGPPLAEPEHFDVSRLLRDHASRQAEFLRMADDRSSVMVHADPILVSAMVAAAIQDAQERGATRINLSAAHLPGQSEAEVMIRDDGRAPGSAPVLPGADGVSTTGPSLTPGTGHGFLRAAVAENLGRLEVSSAPGSGVAVRLILPVPVTDLASQTPAARNTTP